MKGSKAIILDSDIISHLMASGRMGILRSIFQENHLIVVDQVYDEASYCPGDGLRKEKLDSWIEKDHIVRLAFPSDLSSEVVDEYLRLKAANPTLGKGKGLVFLLPAITRILSPAATSAMSLPIALSTESIMSG